MNNKTNIDVNVCEVGPRDGLQNVKSIMPTEDKLKWIKHQAKAGFTEFEVCSFVPASVIRGMQDAEQVVKQSLDPTLCIGALAPNFIGAKNAINAGADKVSIPISVSTSHCLANVKKTPIQMVSEIKRICELKDSISDGKRPLIEAGLSCAFGCAVEGNISFDSVRRLAYQCVEAGVDEIELADTYGYANPSQVKQLFALVKRDIGEKLQSVHLHNTLGLGLANALAAVEAGARSLDSSLGGLGGCPFAPGASGNIVTEDLVYLLHSQGYSTGIDLEKLIVVRAMVENSLSEEKFLGYFAQLKDVLNNNYLKQYFKH